MTVDERLQAHFDRMKADGVIHVGVTLDPTEPYTGTREELKEALCEMFDACNDPTKCKPIDWEELDGPVRKI